MKNQKHLCECGCSLETGISKRTYGSRGIRKGDPYRFLPGHNHRGMKGPLSAVWNGGRFKTRGYVKILLPEHPRAIRGYVLEHVLVCEKALGKPLPKHAVPHHVNEQKSDNDPSNLVICENCSYHLLLHVRTRALKACGNPTFRKCVRCGKYDDPKGMQSHGISGFAHAECNRLHHKNRKGKRRKKEMI